MTTGKASTGTKLDAAERQIEAINSLTTALKVSGVNRARTSGAERAREGGRLTNGDPTPLMLWGEE